MKQTFHMIVREHESGKRLLANDNSWTRELHHGRKFDTFDDAKSHLKELELEGQAFVIEVIPKK